jgi:hypothetical protein
MARPTSRVSGVLMRGPLVPFEDAYREELRRRGYTVRSAVCGVRLRGSVGGSNSLG